MKRIITLIVCCSLIHAAGAQVMSAKSQWVTFSVPQLKCWECRKILDDYLKREKGPADDAGIMRWNIYLTTATIRIQFIPDRISADAIRTAINNAGFDADTAKATDDSYKSLPPACKRKEDGGGPQKGKPCSLPPEDRSGMLVLPNRLLIFG